MHSSLHPPPEEPPAAAGRLPWALAPTTTAESEIKRQARGWGRGKEEVSQSDSQSKSATRELTGQHREGEESLGEFVHGLISWEFEQVWSTRVIWAEFLWP